MLGRISRRMNGLRTSNMMNGRDPENLLEDGRSMIRVISWWDGRMLSRHRQGISGLAAVEANCVKNMGTLPATSLTGTLEIRLPSRTDVRSIAKWQEVSSWRMILRADVKRDAGE